tara:strand:+ start:28634 stop:31933 length:3300 start_codon:yes stop_codon:yes gene_type:complete
MILNEEFDFLKVKPMPKKKENYNFFLNKKQPNVIDKTETETFDEIDFFKKIQDKLNIKTFNKIESLKKQTESIDKIVEDKIKYFLIKNIQKTDIKIIIKQIEDAKKDTKKDTIKKERETKKPNFKKVLDKTYNFDTLDLEYEIKDVKLKDRINELKPQILIKASEYYLNNRETFINFINKLFLPYKENLLKEEQDIANGKINISCDEKSGNEFSLLTHQKIVRDYINILTPYRGLLLYHGLGSGKTCSSIAIAEGLKNNKEILVFTPASLRDNYIDELKKCGDFIYIKNQFWEFININLYPDYLQILSNLLNLPEEYIKEKKGAWLMNKKEEPNYDKLDFEKQQLINEQINKMISMKYKFYSYNGMTRKIYNILTQNDTINPFNNKVIIIDEAHNFISRIVNKITRPTSISMKLYNYLMESENSKIVMLSGTPIINYPNEISIMFNILRGYINGLSFKLNDEKQKYSMNYFEKLFKTNSVNKHIDFIEYNQKNKQLTIIQNPFGFVNHETNIKKIKDDSKMNIYELNSKIIDIFQQNNINFYNKDNIIRYKALHDNFDEFKKIFINENNTMKNDIMFKKRIVGLTSYFRSAQEQLMPRYETSNFVIQKIEMSTFQFGVYEEARINERTQESKNKKNKAKKNGANNDDIYGDSVSTYRIFSRAFCNFVFPKPDIIRPMPKLEEKIENILENIEKNDIIKEDIIDNVEIDEKFGDLQEDDVDKMQQEKNQVVDDKYNKRIIEALNQLDINASKYLTPDGLKIYSPKFLNILENIKDEDHKGIHLLYSQFKSLEGIGIFKLVLKHNDFIEFKIKKNSEGEYILNIDPKDYGKKMYASYTGSETQEEREIIKNVLNSNWKFVPINILNEIKKISPNNYFGEVIKVLMITSSGAEGISLKNVRYVHIMEPYWHPVRIQQVIGRARRICSHSDLPKEFQDVNVVLYLMTFSEEQLKSDKAIELRLKDRSKIDPKNVVSSDEFLYEISKIKENINSEILNNLKQSSIDCSIHSRSTSKESIKCFSIGNSSENNLMYRPDINSEQKDSNLKMNQKQVTLKLYKIRNENLALNKETNDVYDYDAYKKGDLVYLGKFVKNKDGKYELIN